MIIRRAAVLLAAAAALVGPLAGANARIAKTERLRAARLAQEADAPVVAPKKPAAKQPPRSGMAPCFSSGSFAARGTSKFKSWATSTAIWFTFGSVIARCSVVTRK